MLNDARNGSTDAIVGLSTVVWTHPSDDLSSQLLQICLDRVTKENIPDTTLKLRDRIAACKPIQICLTTVVNICIIWKPERRSETTTAWINYWPNILRWIIFLDNGYNSNGGLREDNIADPTLVASVLQIISSENSQVMLQIRENKDILLRLGRLWLSSDAVASAKHGWRSLAHVIPNVLGAFELEDHEITALFNAFAAGMGNSPTEVAKSLLRKLVEALGSKYFPLVQLSLHLLVIAGLDLENTIVQELVAQGSLPLAAQVYYTFISHNNGGLMDDSKIPAFGQVLSSVCYCLMHLHKFLPYHPKWIAPVLEERLFRSFFKSAASLNKAVASDRNIVLSIPEYMLFLINHVIGPHLVYPIIMNTIRRCINSIDHDFYLSHISQHHPEISLALQSVISTVDCLKDLHSNTPKVCHRGLVKFTHLLSLYVLTF